MGAQVQLLCLCPIASDPVNSPAGELSGIIGLGKLECRAAAAGLECAFKHKARTADITIFQQTVCPREQCLLRGNRRSAHCSSRVGFRSRAGRPLRLFFITRLILTDLPDRLGLGCPNRLTACHQRPRPLSLKRLDLTAGSREIALEMLGLLALPTQCLLLLDALSLGGPNRLAACHQRPSPLSLKRLDLTAGSREIALEMLGVLALPTQCLLLLDALGLGGPNRLTACHQRPSPLSLKRLDLTAGSREIALEMLGVLALPTQCLLLLDALGLGGPNRLTACHQRPSPLSLKRLDLTAGSREIALEMLGVLALPTQCLLLLDALSLGGPNRLAARRQRPSPLSLKRLDLTAGSREIALEMLGVLALPTQCLLLLDALSLGGPNRLAACHQRPSPLSLKRLDLTAGSREIALEMLGVLALPTQCLLLLDALSLGGPNRLTASPPAPEPPQP